MQIFREEYQKDTCISAMSMDADAKHVMSQWKEINNPALRWLKERTAKTSSRSLILDEAYVDYRNWCRDNGHKELNKIHFSRQIARNVKRIRDTGDVSTFLGISLKPIESRHFNVLN
jgi:phage/plasmid-associated DNA primase